MKTLVLYTFHEYNERVSYFIQNAFFERDNVDFLVVCCDINDTRMESELPTYVKLMKRENIGFDFGAWSDGLFKDDLYKNYDNFIFVNSSVIVPFIPSYYKGKWTDIYINGLQNNVKLFGSTINASCDPMNRSHVQSYIFSMDKLTLEYLIDCEIFSITNYAKTFDDAIYQKEVLMSRKIIENNWNIGSLLSYYKDVDFTFRSKKPSEYNMEFLDDIMYPNFKDTLWNVYELVFIKGNRINV
jgi:hypothetical protein